MQNIFSIIKDSVKKHVLTYIAINIGQSFLTDSDIAFLKQQGVTIPEKKYGSLDEAFLFAFLANALPKGLLKKLSYSQYQSLLNSQRLTIPLTEKEREALAFIKARAYNDISGLGDVICKETGNILIEESLKNKARYEKIIKKETMQAIRNRESQKSLAARLGKATQDWTRDFGRISDYIMHQAFEEGTAAVLERQFGSEVEVYKDVYEKACKYCVELYLTDGIDSPPRIFKLSTLRENGTNIDVATKDWSAVIGPTHPYCRCTLQQIPKNREWSVATKSFSTVIPVLKEDNLLAQKNAKIGIEITLDDGTKLTY